MPRRAHRSPLPHPRTEIGRRLRRRFLALAGRRRGGSFGCLGYTGGHGASIIPAAVSRSLKFESSGAATGEPRTSRPMRRRQWRAEPAPSGDGPSSREQRRRVRPSRMASTPALRGTPGRTRPRKPSCAVRSGCSRRRRVRLVPPSTTPPSADPVDAVRAHGRLRPRRIAPRRSPTAGEVARRCGSRDCPSSSDSRRRRGHRAASGLRPRLTIRTSPPDRGRDRSGLVGEGARPPARAIRGSRDNQVHRPRNVGDIGHHQGVRLGAVRGRHHRRLQPGSAFLGTRLKGAPPAPEGKRCSITGRPPTWRGAVLERPRSTGSDRAVSPARNSGLSGWRSSRLDRRSLRPACLDPRPFRR